MAAVKRPNDRDPRTVDPVPTERTEYDLTKEPNKRAQRL